MYGGRHTNNKMGMAAPYQILADRHSKNGYGGTTHMVLRSVADPGGSIGAIAPLKS